MIMVMLVIIFMLMIVIISMVVLLIMIMLMVRLVMMFMMMMMMKLLFSARCVGAPLACDSAADGAVCLLAYTLLLVLARLHWSHLSGHGDALKTLVTLPLVANLRGNPLTGHLRHGSPDSFLLHLALHHFDHLAAAAALTHLLLVHPAHGVVLLHVLVDHVRRTVVVVLGHTLFSSGAKLQVAGVAVHLVTLFHLDGCECGLHIHEAFLHVHVVTEAALLHVLVNAFPTAHNLQTFAFVAEYLIISCD